jgi:hypothetical protein
MNITNTMADRGPEARAQASPVQQLMALVPAAHEASADVMVVTNHAVWTHLDALGHQGIGGLVYPGRPMAGSVTPAGVTHGSTTAFAAGVLTRGPARPRLVLVGV